MHSKSMLTRTNTYLMKVSTKKIRSMEKVCSLGLLVILTKVLIKMMKERDMVK